MEEAEPPGKTLGASAVTQLLAEYVKQAEDNLKEQLNKQLFGDRTQATWKGITSFPTISSNTHPIVTEQKKKAQQEKEKEMLEEYERQETEWEAANDRAL